MALFVGDFDQEFWHSLSCASKFLVFNRVECLIPSVTFCSQSSYPNLSVRAVRK